MSWFGDQVRIKAGGQRLQHIGVYRRDQRNIHCDANLHTQRR